MNVLCKAHSSREQSEVNFLIFDWSPAFVAMLKKYQQFIRDSALRTDTAFLHLTLSMWSCTVVRYIDEGEACDGLIQAKEKVENENLDFVFLDDSVDIKTGVETLRMDVSTVNIDARRFYWEIGLKYETGMIESSLMEILNAEDKA